MKNGEVRKTTLLSISYGTFCVEFPNDKKSLLSSTSNAYGRDKTKAAIGCQSCELFVDCSTIGRFFCVEWSGAESFQFREAATPLGFITCSQSLTEVENG